MSAVSATGRARRAHVHRAAAAPLAGIAGFGRQRSRTEDGPGFGEARLHAVIEGRLASPDVVGTILACDESERQGLTCGLYRGVAGRVEVGAAYERDCRIRSALVLDVLTARELAAVRKDAAEVLTSIETASR